jgi:hypothetical protein
VVYVPDHREGRSVQDWFASYHLQLIDVWPSEGTQQAARRGTSRG